MTHKLTVTFTEPEENAQRTRRIREIVAEGFYDYLKANGHLRRDPAKAERIHKTLDESRRIRLGID